MVNFGGHLFEGQSPQEFGFGSKENLAEFSSAKEAQNFVTVEIFVFERANISFTI